MPLPWDQASPLAQLSSVVRDTTAPPPVAGGSGSDDDVVLIDADDVSNYNPKQILPEDPETIQKIRSWLQPTAYDIAGGEYRKHLASHVAGTGGWLTSSSTYKDWLEDETNGLLWIKGIPGSGKSVMAANIINEIAKANPGCPVLFFFFRQIIAANHEPKALLRDWMDQLLDYSPPLQKQLKGYKEARRSIDSLSMEDMWKDLRMAFRSLNGKVFCVADALDEMDQGNDLFLQTLGALGNWKPGKVKVLITSRPVPAVEGPLRKTPCLHIRLEENMVDLDISTYVQFALSKSSIPKSEWQTIANAVPGRANGLFLYAKLAMDAFLEPGADIQEVLKELPADLNVLYTDLLKEHAHRSGVAADIQHLILQAVTHATRPLRLLELAEMINVISSDGLTRDLKATKELIRVACGPLLEILADETVSVVHHSFTEYLKGMTRSDDGSGYPILRPGPTHAQLALACLKYLQIGCLGEVKVNIDDTEMVDYDSDLDQHMYGVRTAKEDVVGLRLKHPFFAYAASNWNHHIDRSETAGHDQSELNQHLDRFLGEDQNRKAWLQLNWPGGEKKAIRVTPLHIAAKMCLLSYTKQLLESSDVNALDVDGKTPLWWAATEGHAAVIRELVAAGANPDQEELRRGLKPLHEAASRNHYEAVKALLEAGVDPLTPKTREDPGQFCGNAPTSTGHTPLMYAYHNGHLEAVEAFLPYLKDIDTVHRALSWAASLGRGKVVARICEVPGVNVNAKVRGETLLYSACGSTDLETIKVLLQAGADPSHSSEDYGDEFDGIGGISYFGRQSPKFNCMHRLCGMGQRGSYSSREKPDLEEIFRLLVDAGVDIHKRTPSGDTPLHGAVTSAVLTRLLLDAGADANAANNMGNTPLHVAESKETMALLIENGHADINARNKEGETPLLRVLSSYHTDVIMKLLEYRPDCTVVDSGGDGVLHLSLRQSNSKPEIIKALLDSGADPNLKNSDGLTPLLSITNGLNEADEIMDLLLAAGADINAVDRDGSTLLSIMIAKTSYGVKNKDNNDLRRIIERGASIHTRDFHGRTLLHKAVRHTSIGRSSSTFSNPEPGQTRIEFLLGVGLYINVTDYHGNGLIHEMALRADSHDTFSSSKAISHWENIIEMGLDVEQRNHAGRTPLHLLSWSYSDERWPNQGQKLPIDFVISRTKNLNVPDNDGVTPLHVAVTGGEANVKRLLDAGADPTAVTHDGLNALHIAARCRNSNVVGLLLDALRSKGDVALEKALNPKERAYAASWKRKQHYTPLFMACRSGRPETVALLLEAGADISKSNVFQACAEFEAENDLWTAPLQQSRQHGESRIVAVKLDDSRRPGTTSMANRQLDRLYGSDTTRLEEILNLLVKHGVDVTSDDNVSSIESAIRMAINGKRDYTAACLRKLRTSAPNKEESGKTMARKLRVAQTPYFDLVSEGLNGLQIDKLQQSGVVESGENNQTLFLSMMKRREYDLVEELSRLGAVFLPIPGLSHRSNLSTLISSGFTSLVDKIGTTEAAAKLESGEWHAFGDKARPGLWYAKRKLPDQNTSDDNPLPFLLDAVHSDLPNLDMVRLLVEKFAVDIDEMEYAYEYVGGDGGGSKYKTIQKDSALHYVSRGYTWWHVHQALPYLLEAGAQIDIRNSNGKTPLLMALKGDGNWPGPFNKDAVRKLVEAGANVNAVDNEGQTCLGCAQHHIDMTRLLIDHGAIVTVDSIISAIDARNIPVLRELLRGGADANMRRIKEAPKKRDRHSLDREVEPHEVYPLYHAVNNLGRYWKSTPEVVKEREEALDIIQVLLDNGADPFAKFITKADEGYDISAATPSIEVPTGYRECTVLHEVFYDGRVPDNFLAIRELDVNHRDADGRTLLLAASAGKSGTDYVLGSHKVPQENNGTVFHRLLSMGADVEARDNFGRNILHHMIDNRPGNEFNNFKHSFSEVLRTAPHLVNQADNNGRTPLHYAAVRAATRQNPRIAELLLEAGADPLAVTNEGDTVLHMLSSDLHSEDIQALFKTFVEQRGVGVNTPNIRGETPVFGFSVRAPESREARRYRGLFSGFNKVEQRETTAIPMLQALGVDFFARDKKGRGLLHLAAKGSVRRFKELMALGLDPMLEDEAHQTAIDVAAASVNEKVLELFEKKDGNEAKVLGSDGSDSDDDL